MTINSKSKGARFEREIAAKYRAAGFNDCRFTTGLTRQKETRPEQGIYRLCISVGIIARCLSASGLMILYG